MICRICGSTNQASSRFCNSCGTQLAATATSGDTPKKDGLWLLATTAGAITLGIFIIFVIGAIMPGETKPSNAGQTTAPQTEQQQAALVRGIDIDYDSFYAEARTTGLKIGQRYRFTAQYINGGNFLSSGPGMQKILPASPAFDDPAQYTEFLKGDTLASRTFVASLDDDGKVYVHAVE
jgi:hypothetical protein